MDSAAIGLGWGGLSEVLSIACITVVWIVLVILAIHSLMVGGEPLGANVRTARDRLEDHLARGDIDREEYVNRRKALDNITAMV